MFLFYGFLRECNGFVERDLELSIVSINGPYTIIEIVIKQAFNYSIISIIK